MANVSDLKKLSNHSDNVEKTEGIDKPPKVNGSPTIAGGSKSPKKTTKRDLKNNSTVSADENSAASNNHGEKVYQTQALSKKDKRKLKKIQKKNAIKASYSKEEDVSSQPDLTMLARSDSESEQDEENKLAQQENLHTPNDVTLSDVEFDSDADVVPYQRLTINNVKAIKDSLQRISIPWEKLSFQEHQSVTSKTNSDKEIKDIYDDTHRELSFYKQALDSVLYARDKLKALKVPFKRPLDYFAEMVKTDEHMDHLTTKLFREASEKEARKNSRKQRELKKFGKQLQVATLQQRQKDKRDTLEKIKRLQKKRKHNDIDNKEFASSIEEITSDKKHKLNHKRAAKNATYGSGGMKRFKRKNDAKSSADISRFSIRKMKAKSSRSKN